MNIDQRYTEEFVNKYVDFLDTILHDIQALKVGNIKLSEIQKAYTHAVEDCILKAKVRIDEVRNGAVWDNLVIAFFGVTEAGKSTIIETFRILFEEKSRSEQMTECNGNVDGLIVGDGSADFTQTYTEYELNIKGNQFTLIDVPGIEGNEAIYEERISEALAKAHIVFYVHGKNTKPDAGTVEKIKKYLRDWVKVYSVYNVQSVKYKEDDQALVDDNIQKAEKEITDTFKQVLGNTYMGNITLQALLAMCSKASFSPERQSLICNQEDFLEVFQTKAAMYDFSCFESLVQLVCQKSANFKAEIVEANKEKHRAMLSKVNYIIKNSLDENSTRCKELVKDLEDFQISVSNDFYSCINNIDRKARERYNQIYDEISFSMCRAIDNNMKDLNTYGERKQKEIIDNCIKNLKNDIKDAVVCLNDNIKKRRERLAQQVEDIQFLHSSFRIEQINLNDALSELDFQFKDVQSVVGKIIPALIVILVGGGWWIAIITGIVSVIFGRRMPFFGKKDRKDDAKKAIQKKLSKAKDKHIKPFNDEISRIKITLNAECEKTAVSIAKEISNIKDLNSAVQSIIDKDRIEISKLIIQEYGRI